LAVQREPATNDAAPAVAGDESTGAFRPERVGDAAFERLDRELLDRVAALPGLTSTVSDVLDELGVDATVAGSDLPLRGADRAVAGHALTLRYRPEATDPGARLDSSRLAHHVAFETAAAGDVLVVEVPHGGSAPPSVFGGVASLSALEAGLSAVVLDGSMRDLDEVREMGFAAWSRFVTPRTGKWRLQAAEVNGPIHCAGYEVVPGDLVVADLTGVCFVPASLAGQVAARTLEVAGREGEMFAARRPTEG
jgi:4-hydroxy-4-methyl-2-oxoglutarate aldolase